MFPNSMNFFSFEQFTIFYHAVQKYKQILEFFFSKLPHLWLDSGDKLWIMNEYKLDREKYANQHLKATLAIGVKNGLIIQVTGAGASGSFKLGDGIKKSG